MSWQWIIAAFVGGMFVGALIWERVGKNSDISIGKVKIRGRANRMDTDIIQHTANMKPDRRQQRLNKKR